MVKKKNASSSDSADRGASLSANRGAESAGQSGASYVAKRAAMASALDLGANAGITTTTLSQWKFMGNENLAAHAMRWLVIVLQCGKMSDELSAFNRPGMPIAHRRPCEISLFYLYPYDACTIVLAEAG